MRQDLFVLSELGFKKNGFFVEFGATNGIDISNTYLLEEDFGWTGILAEPARCWQRELSENRSAAIETKCIWRNSGDRLRFKEVSNPDLSTIESFSAADLHRDLRKTGATYEVETISLNDLLDKHAAPALVDNLIDTEGSEYDILSACDFAKHQFAVITCEHNFTPSREQIHSLLTRNGYTRKYPEISRCDDWYVLT
jgi:FkbM family methyltransferase